MPIRFAKADLIAYAFNIGDQLDHEPTSFKEAYQSKDKELRFAVMKEKMTSLCKNNTWKLVDKPLGKRIISCKWVFKKKKSGIPGVESTMHNARVVAKDFSQVEGVDYHDIFSSVVKHSSIRLLLACVAMFDLELTQLDVKIVFLHRNLEEIVCMQ